MAYINGIIETSNPLLIITPIILMLFSGYAVGRIISKLRQVDSIIFKDFIYGNVLINFLFISGFIIFGLITYNAKFYFTTFTYVLLILSIFGIYCIIKSLIHKYNKPKFDISVYSKIFILFGISLCVSVIVYHAIIIFYHPIFEEYDAIYNYLLSSKSILLDDGLNYDYYRMSDVSNKTPPIPNVINAWLIEIFGYSSLRLFPLYFVILSSLYVYNITKRITNDSFVGLIGATAFLITPSTLIISSRFSLSNDLIFIFFLTTSFCFLLEIISQNKVRKMHLLMLIVSLSLLSLSKELGLIFSVAVFSLLVYSKFSYGNPKLKIFFIILTFLPLYFLTFFDLFNYGITPLLLIRLFTVLIANFALFHILSRVKNQETFTSLLHNYRYFVPLLIPMIFILNNIITIHGPYPILTFSGSSNESYQSFRELFGIQNKIFLDLTNAIEKIPRIDILFVAVAMGSMFVFFKLRGFLILLKSFKDNSQYAVLLTSFILLLVIWSYFDLGFESAQIRHIGYFAPILSIILALSMGKKGIHYKLYYYGILVFSAYYFLSYNIKILNYDNHFDAFWIDPYKNSTISLLDFEIAAILLLSIIIIELKEHRILHFLKKNYLQSSDLRKYLPLVTIAFFILLGIQVHTLTTSGIVLGELKKINSIPHGGWENNVFDVINYLNHSASGNTMSLSAPAISFFTNRTNFELYDPHTYASISPLLYDNSTRFKQKLSEMNIQYFIIPNEKSSLYNTTQKLMNSSDTLKIVKNDNDFLKISLKSYDIYKFDKSDGINLIDKNYTWVSFGNANVFQTNNTLYIGVDTKDPNKVYHRAILQTELILNPPLLFSLEYASQSIIGNATFYAEISDNHTKQILWGYVLGNSLGKMVTETFQLPNEIAERSLEIKFYIITNESGQHLLTVKNARMTPT